LNSQKCLILEGMSMQAFLNQLKPFNWRALFCMLGFALAGVFAVWGGRLIWLDGLFLPLSTLGLATMLVMLPLLFATYHGTRMEIGGRWKQVVIRIGFYLAFIYYLFLLYCFLFAGGRADYDYSYNPANWIPFQKVIAHFANGDSFGNLVFLAMGYLKNTGLFVPLGFLLPYTSKKMKNLGLVAGGSLLLIIVLEMAQHCTHTGFFDVDDVIFNLIGVICGFCVSRLNIVKESLRFVINTQRRKPIVPRN